jgi:hypothetical protein
LGFGTIFADPKYLDDHLIADIILSTKMSQWRENPEDGPKALQILKEKAFSFVEE